MAKETNKQFKTEEQIKQLEAEVEVFTIEEFCSLKSLNKYYLDSLTMSFGKEVKKSIKEWENTLIEGKLIKKEQIIK